MQRDIAIAIKSTIEAAWPLISDAAGLAILRILDGEMERCGAGTLVPAAPEWVKAEQGELFEKLE